MLVKSLLAYESSTAGWNRSNRAQGLGAEVSVTEGIGGREPSSPVGVPRPHQLTDKIPARKVAPVQQREVHGGTISLPPGLHVVFDVFQLSADNFDVGNISELGNGHLHQHDANAVGVEAIRTHGLPQERGSEQRQDSLGRFGNILRHDVLLRRGISRVEQALLRIKVEPVAKVHTSPQVDKAERSSFGSLGDENVGRFHVPVDDASIMKGLEGRQGVGCDPLDHFDFPLLSLLRTSFPSKLGGLELLLGVGLPSVEH
mmetsp:Transcript_48128/g.151014  ORF Transcript_48128/g.151014 Transcript_48128/m.151014 type:complete len:258 (-) Transcript_48128:853-1626(-)